MTTAFITHGDCRLHDMVDFDVHHGNGTEDIFRDDDMAMLNLVEADYAWVTERVKAVAARHAGGRIVSVLEGGYELHALGRSVAAHLKVMSGL